MKRACPDHAPNVPYDRIELHVSPKLLSCYYVALLSFKNVKTLMVAFSYKMRGVGPQESPPLTFPVRTAVNGSIELKELD